MKQRLVQIWQAPSSRFALIVLMVLLLALPTLTYPMGRDQGMYANIGRTILAGGTPFIDMWDIKPPPIYYLYALVIGLFGATTTAIRALDFLFVPLGMVGLYLFGAKFQSRKLGYLAALLYGIFYFREDFQNLSQNDSLVTVPMIWAAYASLRAQGAESASRSALLWASLAGALCGLILWFKHYYLFFVLILVFNQLWSRWRDGKLTFRVLWQEGLAFSLGGVLTGGSLLLYFWQAGIFNEMLIIAEGTAAYNAQGYDFGAFISNMSHYWSFRSAVWYELIILSLFWLPTRFFRPFEQNWRLPLLWLASALAFAFIQAKGFDTHWIPMLPVLALISANTLNRLVAKISPNHKVRWAAYSLILILIAASSAYTTWGRAWFYLTGQESQTAYFDRFQANDLKPEQSLTMATYLRERVAQGDSLFIWGFRPEVYYMAGLRPATRYQAHFPLVATWYPDAWQQHNVDILWAAMPPYTLVLEDDYMAWVTDRSEDSHQLLQEYTELNNWLIANYERVDKIGDFIIWKRRSS